MISMRHLIRSILEPKRYLWIDAILVKKTPKAILIVFDGHKTWIPKAWLRRIKHTKGNRVIASLPGLGKTRFLDFYSLADGHKISIQLSEYHWVRNIK